MLKKESGGLELNLNHHLQIDVELFDIVKVDDWYNDKSITSRLLRKGVGAGSPYSDYNVSSKFISSYLYIVRVKFFLNETLVYSNLDEDLNPKEIPQSDLLHYDLELKHLPSCMSKLLKQMKKREISELTIHPSKKMQMLRNNFL